MILRRFHKLGLQKKFFFTILVVIMAISGTIALLARWILVSSLTDELQMRGTAIAHSVAARGAGFILDGDTPQLVGLIFDEAQLRERTQLVAYIYVLDTSDALLAHTFIRPFPSHLKAANPLPEGAARSMELVRVHGREAYDIAVPVREGLYQIGTVHVGLNKAHMDSLVGKLRVTFLGFITAVVIITFIISHYLARYITAPVSRLTNISDDLSRGNFNTAVDLDMPDQGWNILDCPAYSDTDLPCWHFDDQRHARTSPEHLHRCRTCVFYRKRQGDEVIQLADSFRNMVWSIKLYKSRKANTARSSTAAPTPSSSWIARGAPSSTPTPAPWNSTATHGKSLWASTSRSWAATPCANAPACSTKTVHPRDASTCPRWRSTTRTVPRSG